MKSIVILVYILLSTLELHAKQSQISISVNEKTSPKDDVKGSAKKKLEKVKNLDIDALLTIQEEQRRVDVVIDGSVARTLEDSSVKVKSRHQRNESERQRRFDAISDKSYGSLDRETNNISSSDSGKGYSCKVFCRSSFGSLEATTITVLAKSQREAAEQAELNAGQICVRSGNVQENSKKFDPSQCTPQN